MPARPSRGVAGNNPIHIRPPAELRAKFLRITRELDKSEGELTIAAIAILVEMIEVKTPMLPNLVRMVRVLRKHEKTMLDAPSPLLAPARRK